MDTKKNYLEYYTVDRTPAEVRRLLEWVKGKCHDKLLHEDLFAYGVYTTLLYLLRACDVPPQNYYGLFTFGHIMRQTPDFSLDESKK